LEKIKNSGRKAKEKARSGAHKTTTVARSQAGGFATFIREQGVVGLAVGFILGAGVAKVVTSLVNDIINPIIGGLLGQAGGLKSATFKIGAATVAWGSFVGAVIDFVIIAAVVYLGVKILHLDRLDVKSDKPPLAKVPPINAKLGK
jgi:large conductance mechanosensitive channel